MIQIQLGITRTISADQQNNYFMLQYRTTTYPKMAGNCTESTTVVNGERISVIDIVILPS